MIAYTSKPGLKINGLTLPQWDPSQFTSWINTVLTPWVNNRSGMVLITSQEVTTAVASVDFTEGITTDFDAYLLVISDLIPATDNSDIWLRVSEDSGTTWEDDASDYRHTRVGNTDGGAPGGAGSTGDTKIILADSAGSDTGESFSAAILFTTPSGASYKKVLWIAGWTTDTGTLRTVNGAAQYDGSVNAINGVQVLPASGNLEAGTYMLYGLRM